MPNNNQHFAKYEHSQFHVTKDGHTMTTFDIAKELNRKSFLEAENVKATTDSDKHEWNHIDKLPPCEFESEEDHDADGYPQWHGMVSASLEITDGYNYARGHFREDGSWVIYGAEHDFQMVEPHKITHWMRLPKLP